MSVGVFLSFDEVFVKGERLGHDFDLCLTTTAEKVAINKSLLFSFLPSCMFRELGINYFLLRYCSQSNHICHYSMSFTSLPLKAIHIKLQCKNLISFHRASKWP